MSDETLFHQALERPPHEREAFLRQVCGSDDMLRRRIETLLDAHQCPAGFMEQPCQSPPSDPVTMELELLAPAARPGSLGRLAHYEILEVVGSGGFGVVYKAFDEQLQRVVAIKTLSRSLAASATARKRFEREAVAAAAVNHEHVVDIYAVDGSGPVPFLVMEFVAGSSLDQHLKQTGPLGLKEILRIGLQIAEGLAAAHKQGLVHRDVKPANILLENGVQRSVKITDFGLARLVDDASLTQTGLIAGTPSFMSPEQARGEAVDRRSDLFSLGSVLYAMCTGQSPFKGSSSLSVIKRVCEEEPRPIRDSNPEIPEWLCAIIGKLHAKQPADRYQSGAEVAELLNHHLASVQQGSPVSTPLQRIENPRVRRFASRPGSRWWVGLVAALLVVVVALSLAEAGGVTRITATVIQVFTPEGTLIVEVDDPEVQVTIEGDGRLAITGAGPQEVRVRPGNYKVQATKDGKLLAADRELVTISKGGHEVVRIRHEPPQQNDASSIPAPKLLTPLAGAIVPNGMRFGHSRYDWDFHWEEVPGADGYELEVITPAGTISTGVKLRVTSYLNVHPGGYAQHDADWQWRVRAELAGKWGPWSEDRPFRPAMPAAGPAAPPGPPDLATNLRERLRMQPGDQGARRALIHALQEQKQLEEAQHECRELVRVAPGDPNAHELMAVTYAQTSKWDLAEAALTEAVKLDHKNHMGWYQLAALRLQLGNRSGYETACQEMLARFEDAAEPEIRERTSKACLLSSDGAGQLQRVVTLAESLSKVPMSNGYYWHFLLTRSLAEYRAGRFPSAIALAEEAAVPIKLAGERPPVYVMFDATLLSILSMAQHAAGRESEARETFAWAERLAKKFCPDPAAGRPFEPNMWHDWLMCLLLMREAEQTLRVGTPPFADGKPPTANPP